MGKSINGAYLRVRLLSRFIARVWNNFIQFAASAFIQSIQYQDLNPKINYSSAIIVYLGKNFFDLFLICVIFSRKRITFLCPRRMPSNFILDKLRKMNFIIYYDKKEKNFFTLRKLFSIILKLNRSLLLPLGLILSYPKFFSINPVVISRLASKGNLPIIPICIEWKVRRFFPRCAVVVKKELPINSLNEIFVSLSSHLSMKVN